MNSDKDPGTKELTTHGEMHARWMEDPEYLKAWKEDEAREQDEGDGAPLSAP